MRSDGTVASHAAAAAQKGHHVYLVAASAGSAEVDFDDGVWVHRLGPGGPVRDGGDPRLHEAIGRIASRRWIDAIYYPTTDRALLEGFFDLPAAPIPLEAARTAGNS